LFGWCTELESASAISLRPPDLPVRRDDLDDADRINPHFGWGAPVLGQSKVKVEDLVAPWRNGERL
jgi:hypothetical protein